MIDSHCHIDLPVFDPDRDAIIKSALKNGITRILVPGLDLKQTKTLPALQAQYSCLDIAAGFHPCFLHDMSQERWSKELAHMTDWLERHHQKFVAIGEVGLDATISLSRGLQEQVFRDQLALATHFKKPVIIHHRKSHNDIIRLIKQEAYSNGGVIHAFSGSLQIAQTYIELGFKLGVGGTITYPRGQKTRKTLEQICMSALLLETDSPDMPVCGFQGMRNVPERLVLIAQVLAETKNISVNEVIEQTTRNYCEVFSVKSPV